MPLDRTPLRVVFVVAMLAVFLALGSSDVALGLDVTLDIRESAGVARSGEIVTAGVPLPKGIVTSSDQLAVLGKPAQFEILSTWGDGSIRWAAATFPVSVGAHQATTVRVVDGSPPAVAEPLVVTDTGSLVMVTTGPLRFTVGKSSFQLFDDVWLDSNDDGIFQESERMIDPMSMHGSVVKGTSGQTYFSSAATDLDVVVEESGPVRAVIYFRGTHAGTSGEHLEFSGRIYAYRGSSEVRVHYSQTNMIPTSLVNYQPRCLYFAGRGPHGGSQNSLFFEDLSLRTKVRLSGAPTYTLAGDPGQGESSWQEGGATLYQDSSGGPWWVASPDVSFRGYQIRRGSEVRASGNQARGFLDVSDGTRGVTLAIRHFWENFPNALRATDDGTISVAVMPEEWQEPYEHRPGERKSHWSLFYFHDGNAQASGAAAVAEAFHHPLRAIPRAEWFASTDVFEDLGLFDETSQPNYETHNRAAAEGFLSQRERSDYYGWMHFGDIWADQAGGDSPPNTNKASANMEYDAAFACILQAARTAGRDDALSAKWWKLAEEGNAHTADIDIYHVTDGPLQWMWGGMWNHTFNGASGFDDPHRGQSPNSAHSWNRGLLNGYYLSGDRSLLEAATKVGENARWRIMNGPGGPGYSNSNGEERAPGHVLQILTDMYVHTWDESYLTAARKLVSESAPSSYAQYASPHSGSWRTKPWMIAILMKALGRFAHVMQEERGLVENEAIESLLTRAEFMETRAFFDRNGSTPSYYPYQIHGNGTNDEGFVTMWCVRASDAMTWAARFEPDESKRARYRQMAEHGFEDGSRHPWCLNCPSLEYTTAKTHQVLAGAGMEYLADRTTSSDTTAPSRIFDLEAVSGTREGEVRLNWTAPGDDGASGTATRYLVRSANAPILNETDWAQAEAVPQPPSPRASGTREVFVVTGLPAGTTLHFAVRAQDDADLIGPLSNSASASTAADVTPPTVEIAATPVDDSIRFQITTSEPTFGFALVGATNVGEHQIDLGSVTEQDTNFEPTFSSLAPGRTYSYRIGLLDASWNFTQTDGTVVLPSTEKPAAPDSLTIASMSPETGVFLRWARGPEGTAGYVLYKKRLPLEAWRPLFEHPIGWTFHLDEWGEPGAGYAYMVTTVDATGVESDPSNLVVYRVSESGREGFLRSARVRPFGVAPNPFRAGSRTTFLLTLPPATATPTEATLDIYDVGGRHVRSIFAGALNPGEEREVTWQAINEAGRAVAPGVYFYRFRADDFEKNDRIVVLR